MSGAEPESGRAITYEDLQQLVTFKSVEFASDGTRLAFANSRGEVWLLERRGDSWSPRKIDHGSDPSFSPDGNTLAYLKSSPAKTRQLWILSSGQTEPHPLALRVGDTELTASLLAFSWSPGGDEIVLSAAAGDPVQPEIPRGSAERGTPLVLTQDSPAGWASAGGPIAGREFPAVARTEQLFIGKVVNGACRLLSAAPGRRFEPAWSPDGTRIAFIWTDPALPSNSGGASASELHTIDLISGIETILAKLPGRQSRSPRWSPDGRHIAFLPGAASSFRVVELISAEGGPVELLSPASAYDSDFIWSRATGSLLVTRVGDASIDLLEIDPRSRQPVPVTADRFVARLPAASAAGDIAWVASTGAIPSAIRWMPRRGAASVTIFDPNPQVRDWRLATQQVLPFRNAHGFARTAVLLKPPGWEPGKRYPLIVSCYPFGVHANEFQNHGPGYGDQLLAARGYAVLFPRPHMPKHWYSSITPPAEQAAMRGPRGWNVTVDDVLSAVDEAVRIGVADPDRLGLLGHSNGGEVVTYVLTRTHRFKCAVTLSSAGVNYVHWALLEDVRASYDAATREEEALWTKSVGVGDIWRNPQAYVDFSSVFHLDRVRTPLLMAIGDQDWPNVIPNIQVYLALKRQGAEVTFLRYPGQGHIPQGPAARDFTERAATFFARHLQPEK